MSDVGTGKGQPIAFRCSKCRKSKWIGGCASIDRDYTRHCSHRQVRTGRTRPYRGRNTGSRRMLSEHHEYRCECGHVGWSRHRGVVRWVPLAEEATRQAL